jgi:hypothetical protein
MEILDKINWLESLQIDVFVDCFELNGLLVLVELAVPLFLVCRVAFNVWAPVCHAETRVCKSCITTDNDHAQDPCGCQKEPTANEFFPAGFDKLLRILILDETLFQEIGSGWLKERVDGFSDEHFFILLLLIDVDLQMLITCFKGDIVVNRYKLYKILTKKNDLIAITRSLKKTRLT